jgi:hypothetical protein
MKLLGSRGPFAASKGLLAVCAGLLVVGWGVTQPTSAWCLEPVREHVWIGPASVPTDPVWFSVRFGGGVSLDSTVRTSGKPVGSPYIGASMHVTSRVSLGLELDWQSRSVTRTSFGGTSVETTTTDERFRRTVRLVPGYDLLSSYHWAWTVGPTVGTTVQSLAISTVRTSNGVIELAERDSSRSLVLGAWTRLSLFPVQFLELSLNGRYDYRMGGDDQSTGTLMFVGVGFHF